MIESLKKFCKLLICAIYPALISLFIDAYVINSHIKDTIFSDEWAWRWIEPLRNCLFYMAIVGFVGYVVVLIVEIIIRSTKGTRKKTE